METESKQMSYSEKVAKKQLNHMRLNTALTAACFLAVIVAVAFITPYIIDAIEGIRTMVDGVNTLVSDASIAIEDLKEVTAELADVDFAAMMADVDELVSASSDGVRDAVGRLQGIDFSALNKAIGDLNKLIGPLAEFFTK